MMARPPEQQAVKTGPTATAIEILDAFLEWTKTNQAAKTYSWHKDHIQNFISGIPKGITVGELKPYHVTRIMDGREWSNSTKNGFARSVQRGFKWAAEQGLIDHTPLPKVQKPAPESRELFISQEEFDDLLGRFPDQEFRDLLVTIWETGCRPQEAFAVEARNVDLANHRWVFKVKESKGKRSSRVVYLPAKSAEITRRLAQTNTTGKLFLNEDGRPWTKDAVNCRFVRKKKALGRKLCLYHLRHSFAQRMLLAGVDAIVVSQMLGHRDGAMLARVYSHLGQDPDFIHKKMRDATGEGASA